jgi:formylglycine-generating enzyme
MTTRFLMILTLFPSVARSNEPVTPMARIPAGSYVRCAHCRKSDQATISLSAYRLDLDEVTAGQYADCVRAKRCMAARVRWGMEADEPVRGVRWTDAQAYCKFVGKRLPTEAEWERAAFPPTTSTIADGGPRIGTHDPCRELMIAGSEGDRCPGKQMKASLDGPVAGTRQAVANGDPDLFDRVKVSDAADAPEIYDLYGNVAEWVADWYARYGDPEWYLSPRTRTDPKGPPSGQFKIIRGGSFAALEGIRENDRRFERPTQRFKDVGFRCAADDK